MSEPRKRVRYGALRPDRTIDPACFVVTESGCHTWTGAMGSGVPRANFEGRPVSVRHWLLDLPKGSRIGDSCGNDRCVRAEHLIHLRSKSRTDQRTRQQEERKRHAESELARAPDQLRRLLYVRSDIARLLVAVPTGVITDQDRDGLRRYAGGESFQAIADDLGITKAQMAVRLQRADRALRMAEAER